MSPFGYGYRDTTQASDAVQDDPGSCCRMQDAHMKNPGRHASRGLAAKHRHDIFKPCYSLRSTVTQLVTLEPPTLKVTPTEGCFRESVAPIGCPVSCL